MALEGLWKWTMESVSVFGQPRDNPAYLLRPRWTAFGKPFVPGPLEVSRARSAVHLHSIRVCVCVCTRYIYCILYMYLRSVILQTLNRVACFPFIYLFIQSMHTLFPKALRLGKWKKKEEDIQLRLGEQQGRETERQRGSSGSPSLLQDSEGAFVFFPFL